MSSVEQANLEATVARRNPGSSSMTVNWYMAMWLSGQKQPPAKRLSSGSNPLVALESKTYDSDSPSTG